ncbi:hypothetical protein SBRCBS47491_009639, partial [Sporothrix bragantina]
MNDARAWRALPATHPDVPVLLIATEFGPASYAIYVTDLAHVWAERLERRDICMRAFQQDTTIDPSYDNEQMGVFLGKLQVALGTNNDPDASLSLAATADGNLVLHTTSVLPAGLQPLKWPIYLKKQPPTAIASDLVLPLIQNRAVLQRAMTQLVGALQEKDAVINKLVDKLEAMGTGVESAFPTLVSAAGGGGSSRRKITRADMERRVRGLAAFDEAAFRKQMNSSENANGGDDGNTEKTAKLVGEAFGSGNELRYETEAPATATAPKLDSWWEELGSGRGVPLKRDTTSAKNNSQSTVGARDADDTAEQDGDDAFQEATPKRPPPVAASSPIIQAEDPPSPTPAKPKAKAGLGKIGRLGAIGKKAKAASPPPPSPPPPIAKHGVEDEDTASEADEPPKPTVAAVRPKAARGGLGRIGGKKKEAPPPEPEPEAEPEAEPMEEEGKEEEKEEAAPPP